MSTSINKVSYKPLGGGEEFAKWFSEAFTDEEVDGRADLYYIDLEQFESQIAQTKEEFRTTYKDIIRSIRVELKKEKGSADFSIDW